MLFACIQMHTLKRKSCRLQRSGMILAWIRMRNKSNTGNFLYAQKERR